MGAEAMGDEGGIVITEVDSIEEAIDMMETEWIYHSEDPDNPKNQKEALSDFPTPVEIEQIFADSEANALDPNELFNGAKGFIRQFADRGAEWWDEVKQIMNYHDMRDELYQVEQVQQSQDASLAPTATKKMGMTAEEIQGLDPSTEVSASIPDLGFEFEAISAGEVQEVLDNQTSAGNELQSSYDVQVIGATKTAAEAADGVSRADPDIEEAWALLYRDHELSKGDRVYVPVQQHETVEREGYNSDLKGFITDITWSYGGKRDDVVLDSVVAQGDDGVEDIMSPEYLEKDF